MSLDGVPKAFRPPIVLGGFVVAVLLGWKWVESVVEEKVDERAVAVARQVITAEFAQQLRAEVKEAAFQGGRQVVQESVIPLQVRMAELEGWQRGRLGRLEVTTTRTAR